ncbi:peptide synthetase [Streptomyces noursei ZPM]|nr:peptide synthetase [Streptomyces noursei ZPM]EOT03151.2 hypothetical protein K530_15109 [Streptomyces noursei CCRC 11814]
MPGTSPWVEELPILSSESQARLGREREALRPIGASENSARIVLRCYKDAVADLILVARRDQLSRSGLERLSAALTVGRGDDPVDAELLLPKRHSWGTHLPAGPAESLDWFLTDDDPRPLGDAPLVAGAVDGAEALVVAATALVLSRYGSQTEVRLAVIADSAMSADHDRAHVVAVQVRPTTTVGELLDQVASLPSDTRGGSLPAVAVVLTGEEDKEPIGEYQPFVTTLFGLALRWALGADGPTPVGAIADPTDLSSSAADRFQHHVAEAVAVLHQSPRDWRIGSLPFLTDAEREQVLALGGRQQTAGAAIELITDRFRAMVTRAPHSIAVTEGERQITYEELDEASTRWAWALRDRGVERGARVGVLLERSADLAIAFLAILKAGGSYVPLDVRNPEPRLSYVVEDAGIPIVLVDPDAHWDLFDAIAVPTSELTGAAVRELPVGDPSDPAYVIYTSGTTGEPKGVVVQHRNLLALIHGTEEEFALGPGDVWTLFHSCAFDFSVWEMWGCLLTGGRLVVLPYLVTRSPQGVLDVLQREQVTVLNQTPSAFRGLLDAGGRQEPVPTVRMVIFGGEPLDTRMLAPWRATNPDCRLVNMYGITETTVHVTMRDIPPQAGNRSSRSVGRALPGWTVSVRDDAGNVLPPGVAGEIWVGGAGVASGYLNRPSLTAERFVEDPVDGHRYYRSGDKGRLKPDGTVDHLGRLDDQVKLRGYRIELGEVRNALLADEAVKEAAVILEADSDDPAYDRLVGYVVLNSSTADDVRKRLAQRLPDYMLPALLLTIDRVPLTVNGKLDTRRLPTVAALQKPARPAAPDTLQTADEDLILKVWRGILGSSSGRDDDFFDNGGNSMLATHLLSALRDAGIEEVTVHDLYSNPTPRALTELLDSKEKPFRAT